jgi:hypothetical protein
VGEHQQRTQHIVTSPSKSSSVPIPSTRCAPNDRAFRIRNCEANGGRQRDEAQGARAGNVDPRHRQAAEMDWPLPERTRFWLAEQTKALGKSWPRVGSRTRHHRRTNPPATEPRCVTAEQRSFAPWGQPARRARRCAASWTPDSTLPASTSRTGRMPSTPRRSR